MRQSSALSHQDTSRSTALISSDFQHCTRQTLFSLSWCLKAYCFGVWALCWASLFLYLHSHLCIFREETKWFGHTLGSVAGGSRRHQTRAETKGGMRARWSSTLLKGFLQRRNRHRLSKLYVDFFSSAFDNSIAGLFRTALQALGHLDW